MVLRTLQIRIHRSGYAVWPMIKEGILLIGLVVGAFGIATFIEALLTTPHN